MYFQMWETVGMDRKVKGKRRKGGSWLVAGSDFLDSVLTFYLMSLRLTKIMGVSSHSLSECNSGMSSQPS